MKRRLFEDLVVSRSGGRSVRAYTLPVSIAIHGAVLSVALVLPMLTPEEMPQPPTPTWVPMNVALADARPAAPQPPAGGTRHAGRSTAPRPVVRHGALPPVVEPDTYTPSDPTTEQPACLSADCVPGQPEPGEDVGLSTNPVGSPGGPPAVVRAGITVKPPLKLKDVTPIYPELARRAGVEGIVSIECTIDPTGRVVGAQVLRGHPLLSPAALDAVQRWVYMPTLLNGVPVSVILTVTVHFHLQR